MDQQLKSLFLSLRPTHWLKNILIFMPLLFAQELFVLTNVKHSLWAFLALCAAASSIYLINDLIDKKSDSHHTLKKIRPIANGEVSLVLVVITFFFLAILAFT